MTNYGSLRLQYSAFHSSGFRRALNQVLNFPHVHTCFEQVFDFSIQVVSSSTLIDPLAIPIVDFAFSLSKGHHYTVKQNGVASSVSDSMLPLLAPRDLGSWKRGMAKMKLLHRIMPVRPWLTQNSTVQNKLGHHPYDDAAVQEDPV